MNDTLSVTTSSLCNDLLTKEADISYKKAAKLSETNLFDSISPVGTAQHPFEHITGQRQQKFVTAIDAIADT